MNFKFLIQLLASSLFIVNVSDAQFATNAGNTTTNDKVGIGTTNPQEPLTIASSNAFTISLLRNATGGNITSGTSGGAIYFGSYDPTATARYIGAMIRARSSEDWIAGTAQGTVLTFEIAGTGSTTLVERMRIDQNGNVGIGTQTPSVKLEVKGTGRFINAAPPTGGEGLEIDYSTGGRITAIDRTNSVYKTLKINGSSLSLNDASNGNVSVGPVSVQGSLSSFQVHQPNVLGSSQGNFIDISTLSGTGGASNRLMSKLWVVRDNAGNDWATARLHEGVTVDATYTTPMVDTRTWWERDPYNNIQSWGTAASTYMTINAGNVGIGTITPFEPLSIVSGNGNTIGLYRSITGGNPITNGFAGSLNFGTVDPAASTVKYTGAQIQAKATEEWVPGTAQGTALSFRTVPNGTATSGEALRINQNGNIGIGTATPASRVEIVGGTTLGGKYNPANAMFKITGGGNLIMDGNEMYSDGNLSFGYAPTGTLDIGTVDANGYGSKMRFLSNGNIVIGKTTQTNSAYKLDIAGYVRADKLVVNTTGADFVFEPNYTLPSLQSVETFIRKYHHLPGIASANEMQNKGLDVGENQTNLLQKTEELTLYVIDQNKKINQLEEQLHQQNELIRKLLAKEKKRNKK